jgi:hypothetical protein
MNGPFNTPSVPPYPIEAFSVLVRAVGYEVRQNVQAPDALVGMALINAISMACQGLIDVKLPTGQVRPVSQNLLVVAESGERKSTIDSLLLSPFRQADKKAVVAHSSKIEEYQAALECWKSTSKGIHRAIAKADNKGQPTSELIAKLLDHAKLKPKIPRLRYFLRQDITPKAIMESLQGDGESIAIVTDEGQILFQSAAMAHLGLLNRLWDSPEVLPLDRAGKEQILAMNPRVSVSIMTQEAVLKAYLDKRGSVAKGSGHWARYLVAWPISTRGYRWVNPNEAIWEHLPIFHRRIGELLEQYRGMVEVGEGQREIVEFSDDAKARWFELASQTEQMLRQGEYLSDINDFASKVTEILARLAAAMHYFGGDGGKITLDTLERAFTIIRWHVDEAKRLFSPQFTMPQDQVDAQAVVMYLRAHVWLGPASDTFIPKNKLLRNGPVRDRARLNAALELITMWGAIRVGVSPKDKKSYVQLINLYFCDVGL